MKSKSVLKTFTWALIFSLAPHLLLLQANEARAEGDSPTFLVYANPAAILNQTYDGGIDIAFDTWLTIGPTFAAILYQNKAAAEPTLNTIAAMVYGVRANMFLDGNANDDGFVLSAYWTYAPQTNITYTPDVSSPSYLATVKMQTFGATLGYMIPLDFLKIKLAGGASYSTAAKSLTATADDGVTTATYVNPYAGTKYFGELVVGIAF